MSENKTENEKKAVADEIADLEEYAKQGKLPPKSRGYRIRINKDRFEVQQEEITGREVLALASLTPAERYTLRVKTAGGPARKLELDESVDLTQAGVEKFRAIRNDQTEG
ncbi:MAG: multiubiquitin domain-containing protein [Bdellovibrionales bacterium]|nr:multiubiquitin domain-containing protein [Bdellovibrionales bacterium]